MKDMIATGYSPEQDRCNFIFADSRKFPYAKDDNFTLVEIPYGNGAFAFDVLLPKNDIYTSISEMTGEKLDKLFSQTAATKMNFAMPEFKLDFTAEELIDNLKALRMNKPFGEGADFSGLSSVSTYIGLIKQKAFIEVSIKGTEAAAATMIGMRETATGDEVLNITANSPFIFAIRETSTPNTILFIGARV